MPETPALQIRGLSKTFTGQRALIDVDLELEPGEIRALVGQNGCGKSTMIKVLAGYYEPGPWCRGVRRWKATRARGGRRR